jgi:DNA repair protein RecO
MSREQSYQALLLKKQPFGEGDEVVTFFTREGGKLRFFAKSTKLAKSRLQYALQALFLVNVTVTGGSNFPKIIHAQPVEIFPHLREDLPAIKIAYYAVELLLKFTPDGQRNDELFDFYKEFFIFLNSCRNARCLDHGLAKFKIDLLELLGYGVHFSEDFLADPHVGFSNVRGGFGVTQGADFIALNSHVVKQFVFLREHTFTSILEGSEGEGQDEGISQLQDLLSGFIRYHLERDVKSEEFLGQ